MARLPRLPAVQSEDPFSPCLEEHHRHHDHDEAESEIHERESPPTTTVDAISQLALSPRRSSLLTTRLTTTVEHMVRKLRFRIPCINVRYEMRGR
jgi:hypothetical protein